MIDIGCRLPSWPSRGVALVQDREEHSRETTEPPAKLVWLLRKLYANAQNMGWREVDVKRCSPMEDNGIKG